MNSFSDQIHLPESNGHSKGSQPLSNQQEDFDQLIHERYQLIYQQNQQLPAELVNFLTVRVFIRLLDDTPDSTYFKRMFDCSPVLQQQASHMDNSSLHNISYNGHDQAFIDVSFLVCVGYSYNTDWDSASPELRRLDNQNRRLSQWTFPGTQKLIHAGRVKPWYVPAIHGQEKRKAQWWISQ